jgi:SsrA-binding protein
MKKHRNKINIKNKKAFHDYEIIEKLQAGIVLTGTEIKSIRMGKASLVDSYCYFDRGELWVKNMNIQEYDFGTHVNHAPRQDRKLLLNKLELRKWDRKVKESGMTIIVLRLYINERGLAKLEIGLARGKQQYDKRESLKRKDAEREMGRFRKIKSSL